MLQPPAFLLIGSPGSGKTFSIPTLCLAGIETFVITTEPGATESLLDGAAHYRVDKGLLHWASINPTPAGWGALDDMVKHISLSSYEDLTKIKSGIGKMETRKPVQQFLETLKDFRCEHHAAEPPFGDFTTWDAKRALVIDSLSGLSLMMMALTVGFKPAAHQGEWGVAMNSLEQILLKLTSDRQCFLVLTAHIEREVNEITGATQIMASTLGRKLAPKIPRFFSEVVLAERSVARGFSWSTIDNAADLKNRALPVSNTLKPDFRQVVEVFHARAKIAEVKPQTPATTSAA